MNKGTMRVLALTVVLASGAAQAALHDRGGGLVYDDVLDVTWLADANYARTSGYDADGLLSWAEANAWAANLSYHDSVRGVTYDDWRLPIVLDGGAANPYSDMGYNVRTVGEDGTVYSELAYMYYVNLVFKGEISTTGANQSDFGIFGNGTTGGERDGLGPNSVIVNLQSGLYGSGTVYAPSPASYVWMFNFSRGNQGYGSSDLTRGYDPFYAWAVRDGDVAVVPEPTPAALFAAGLAGLALMRRRAMTGVAKN